MTTTGLRCPPGVRIPGPLGGRGAIRLTGHPRSERGPACDGIARNCMMRRFFVGAAVLVHLVPACAAHQTPRVSPGKHVEDAGPHYSEGLSRVIESMPPGADDPQDAANWLTIVFNSGYGTGNLDGLKAKFEHLGAVSAVACAATVEASFQAVAKSDGQRDQLMKLASECSKWKDPRYAGSTIPGASYGPARLRIAQKVARASRLDVSTSLGAFDAGYESGLQDNYPPSTKEIEDAAGRACKSTVHALEKIAGTSLEVDFTCTRVQAEAAAAGASHGDISPGNDGTTAR